MDSLQRWLEKRGVLWFDGLQRWLEGTGVICLDVWSAEMAWEKRTVNTVG